MIFATAEQRDGLEQGANRGNSGRKRGGFWMAVALVFAVQIGLAFWLGSRSLPAPVKPPAAPAIQLYPAGSEELLALQDPTLFMLPHRENFSGDAWLKVPQQHFEPANWTEPTLPLLLAPQQLGSAFATFVQTNATQRFETVIGSEPDSDMVDYPAVESISVPSTLRIEGDVAKRRLLVPVHLPAQTNSDLLANTEVQVLVNAEGIPYSAVVLPPGSGSPGADQTALGFAKSARFEALKPDASGVGSSEKISFGKLIFEWQTLAPAATNAPSTAP